MEDLKELIIEQIKSNKLENLNYDLIINQLEVLNNKAYDIIKCNLDSLIQSGKVKLNGVKAETQWQENQPKRKFKYEKSKNAPKSPYSNRQSNIDMAYDILERKDKKSASKVKRLEGKIQMTSKGYAFLIPDDITQEDIFVAERDLGGAMHNDKVVVSVRDNGGRRREGKVVQVLERGFERVVGLLKIVKKIAYVVPDDVKFGKDISIPLGKLNGAKDGEKVVVKITRYYASKRNPDGEITEVLGEPNKIDTEVLAVIRSYNLYDSFPNKVMELAKLLPESVDKSQYPNRMDLTSLLTFTIDGEDTRDIDDAISIEINSKGNRVLGVHIADVGEYVKKDNAFDKEAYKRGTSVYFPNLVLPMLPRQLSNGICSLNERVDRLALSCFMEFDKDGNVINHKVCESIINSKKRFTYTKVQAIFDGDKDEKPELIEALLNMRGLAKQLAEKRTQRGAIEFNIPEVQVGLNELGDVLTLTKREHNESHRLIESFMIIANEAIATHYLEEKVPFVYRIHEKPDSEKINNLVSMVNSFGVQHKIDPEQCEPKDIQALLDSINGLPCEYVINKIALRCMKKAKYDPECMGHYGIASPKYCHFTSPIRRYPDLTIHRIIKDTLHGQMDERKKLITKEFVAMSSIQSSETERNAEAVERDVDDLYRVFYMTHHIGEEFEGIISSVTNFGVFVELENTVEGMMRIDTLPQDQYEYLEDRFTLKGYNNKFTIGDKVKVKAVRADILSKEIDFELVSKIEVESQI
ncbi:MAG: ribonuclease R [Clostridia bacterium]|nr:ribonuclease R [Clostridia bacterium]